jgi:hypothetical protein
MLAMSERTVSVLFSSSSLPCDRDLYCPSCCQENSNKLGPAVDKDGVRDLLKASECSDYSSPHGNHWLEGTGNVGTSEIYTQYVKQLISKHTNQAQYHQNHEDLESRDEDPLLGDQCTDEEDWETQTVSAVVETERSVGLLATGSPVEAEDERVGVVLSGKDLHYHWIQAEAYLQ